MRTSSLVCAVLACTWLGASPALALDAAASLTLPKGSPFGSVRDALRSGVRDYNAGDKEGAVRALEFAATRGHTLALWKLGSMYASGDGVPLDDLRAFEYFSRIADANAEQMPEVAEMRVVSSAFVALGQYFLNGIKGTYVQANPARAHEMFYYAATFFGDAIAQFNLARLYLDGVGVNRDARTAARWLNLAAEKGHYPSQALLGQMLISGEGVPAERSLGLMWLTLARDAADPATDTWIGALYEQAIGSASDYERESALVNLEQRLRRRR